MNALFQTSLDHFRILPLRVRYRAAVPLHLPPFKGSTLRGAFGRAFRRVACSQGDLECRACLLRETCPYPYVFETAPPTGSEALRNYESVPRPFVIEPPLEDRTLYDEGEELDFGLILFGRAIEYLAYFVITLRELGLAGIGAGRGQASLERVTTADGEAIYEAGASAISKPTSILTGTDVVRRASALPEAPEVQGALTLTFLTPVRLKDQGVLSSHAQFSVLVRALLRRASSVSYFHHGTPLDVDFRRAITETGAVRLVQSGIRWHEWRRYSSRQQTKIAMGGFVGTATYEGDVAPFLPLLELGRWLHLGKNVTFGLGQYEWEVKAEGASY